jgi:hypothetical protein
MLAAERNSAMVVKLQESVEFVLLSAILKPASSENKLTARVLRRDKRIK